jgi:hypothetical protein
VSAIGGIQSQSAASRKEFRFAVVGSASQNRARREQKAKVLTISALVVFVAIGALHYLQVGTNYGYPLSDAVPWLRITDPTDAIVSDVKMPWLCLV